MKVLFASSECAPFFKTGGLGDVTGALPKELAKNPDMQVAVILPYYKYGIAEHYKTHMKDEFWDYVNVGWRHEYVGVKRLVQDNVTYYFLDNENYFGRDEIYGYGDDGERWAFFCLAIAQLMERLAFIPDILHVNDCHTAMLPFLLKEKYQWINAYRDIKTVLTIHNIEFQGIMQGSALSELFGMGMERYHEGVVRHNDMLNSLKTGILYADRVNTVSPTYAQEIQTPEFGCGLDPILRYVSDKLVGIVNGIDYDVYNPATDKWIGHHFSSSDLEGKAKMKQALQEHVGLPVAADKPLIGIVSRLTTQKGFHLVLERMDDILSQDVQVVLLGTGYTDIEQGFRHFSEKYPEKCAAIISFDLKLAQEIYAASDFFLMPSAFEPCGLSQMIAMRYGTLPIVHEIGGLKDTVQPYNPYTTEGTGFGFVDFTGQVLVNTINQALNLYACEPDIIHKLRIRAMKQDFSWKTKAEQYIHLYQELI